MQLLRSLYIAASPQEKRIQATPKTFRVVVIVVQGGWGEILIIQIIEEEQMMARI